MCSPHDPDATRRDFLRSMLGAATAALAPSIAHADARADSGLVVLARGAGETTAARPYLDAALGAARWLRASRIPTAGGVTWPSDPRDPKTVSLDLYGGSPGVVLFLLELHAATGDQAHLDEALLGADELIAAYPRAENLGAGLYTGLGGLAFVFERAYHVGGQTRHLDAARDCVRRIQATAQRAGGGASWGEVNDVVSGTAGTGLLLLRAAATLDDAASLELAAEAGRRLVSLAEPVGDGLRWPMAPSVARWMPNFSHGTAGVAYFLATLHQRTEERAFLDAALGGARHLQSIAVRDGAGFKVHHHDGDGADLFYLSWCHGPAGTARLFHRLHEVTREDEWRTLVDRCASAIVATGIPERRTPGFWNNVGQCCGNAGVAEFFIDVHRLRGDVRYLHFARRNADDLLARATRDAAGTRWVQAEHRVRPELLVAQTGWMQGAAGMGALLLHLDGALAGRPRAIVLPDSPFAA